MTPIKSFPLLSTSEFENACIDLVKSFELHGLEQQDWLSVELIDRSDVKYARITTPLPTTHPTPEHNTQIAEEISESDNHDDEVIS